MRESVLEEQREEESHSVMYLVVWAVLLVLTAVTFFAAKVELGRWGLPVALLIASVKAGLVALYFMHLKDQQGLNRLVFVVSLFFVALLVGLTVSDAATRFPPALPAGSNRAPPQRSPGSPAPTSTSREPPPSDPATRLGPP